MCWTEKDKVDLRFSDQRWSINDIHTCTVLSLDRCWRYQESGLAKNLSVVLGSDINHRPYGNGNSMTKIVRERGWGQE